MPETLVPALQELEQVYSQCWSDSGFHHELNTILHDYVGRPTPVSHLARWSERTGLDIYAKREDLNHTGAHKINNAIGQVLMARRMGKSRIIAETGAGQHGVATATACALFGLPCVVYMGSEDCERQSLNVFRMKLLGAEVRPVESGTRTLKDALNEAMRDWVTHIGTTHYVIGTAAGPHPYPEMVRNLQRVIGDEAREQFLAKVGQLPDAVFACVGGGSNAIGMFTAFLEDSVALYGIEAGGKGIHTPEHAAPLSCGRPGVLHGSYSYMMQNEEGQVLGTHSISAGLDYPGVGAEHSFLKDSGRVTYLAATDQEALVAFQALAQMEGIIPALESGHAFAPLLRPDFLPNGTKVLVTLSGRGDKDLKTVADELA